MLDRGWLVWVLPNARWNLGLRETHSSMGPIGTLSACCVKANASVGARHDRQWLGTACRDNKSKKIRKCVDIRKNYGKILVPWIPGYHGIKGTWYWTFNFSTCFLILRDENNENTIGGLLEMHELSAETSIFSIIHLVWTKIVEHSSTTLRLGYSTLKHRNPR